MRPLEVDTATVASTLTRRCHSDLVVEWHLRRVAATRERWPVAGYLLPADVSSRVLSTSLVTCVIVAVAGVSALIRLIPSTRSLGGYAFSLATLTAATALRRGQTRYSEELERLASTTGATGSSLRDAFISATLWPTVLITKIALLCAPIILIAGHVTARETWHDTVAVAVIMWILLCANLARAYVAHAACYLRELQPPQFLYLVAGVIAGFSSAHFFSSADSAVTLIARVGDGTLALVLVLLSCTVLFFARALGMSAVAQLTTGRRAQSFSYGRLLPRSNSAVIMHWVQPGRTSGSVVFGFGLGAVITAITVLRYAERLRGIKPPYGGPELGVAVVFALSLLIAMALAAPMDMARLPLLADLFRLAKVDAGRERTRILLAVAVPVIIVSLTICSHVVAQLQVTDQASGQGLGAGLVNVASALAISAAAVSFVVAPALKRRPEEGRVNEDEVPTGEMFKTTLPTVLGTTLIQGFVATRTGLTNGQVVGLSLILMFAAAVLFSRLVVLVKAVA